MTAGRAAAWMASFLGFPLGGLVASALLGPLTTPLNGLIGGAVVGLIVGGAQALALRGWLTTGLAWVVASGLGMGLGLALGTAIFGSATTPDAVLPRALVTGLALGLSQWPILRGQIRWALAWIPAITALHALAWAISAGVIGASINDGFYVFGASGALAHQALSGLLLYGLRDARSGGREK